jgi:hypothetical protein
MVSSVEELKKCILFISKTTSIKLPMLGIFEASAKQTKIFLLVER